jgi:phosphoserine phosphatase RsbU/P
MTEDTAESRDEDETGYADLQGPLDVLSTSVTALLGHAKRLDDIESIDDLGVIHAAADGVGQTIGIELPTAIKSADADPATLRRVRHEIRNSLNQIIGLTELIAGSELLGQDDRAATDLALLRRSGNRLLRLVRERLADPAPTSIVPDNDQIPSSLTMPDTLNEPATVDDGGSDPFVKATSTNSDFQQFTFARAVQTKETIVVETAPEELAVPEPAVESKRTAPADILIIDDDQINRETLGRWVKQLGHRFHLADSGTQGLSMITTGSYDLVLLDVLMPEMDGYEFLEIMKGDPTTAEVPVIMISGLDEIDSVARCIELGAEDYLSKPFNAILLRARIQACLEKKRLRDEVAVRHERLQRDLSAARALQASMLPASMPNSTPEFPVSAHAFMEAARDLSGDFYDVFQVSADEIGFVVGDGAKKGVAAALFMARTMGLIRMSTSKWSDSSRTIRSPADTLNEVNTALARGNVELMYATMFMGVLDTSTGFLRYCNAGHVPPFLFGATNKTRALDVPPSLPLGMGEAPYYEDRHVKLAPGEGVFVFTDGVTDALDPGSEPYSTNRLRKDLSDLSDRSVRRVVDGIRDRLVDFMKGTPHHDDMTALCVRWDGPAAA